jgi:putative FmdB family regulatory protein
MPLYDYACTACGRVHEVRHGFDESYDRACEGCGAPVRRVFNPAPVLFKGSGFYVTDSRRSAGSGKAEKPKEEAPAAKSEPPPSTEPKGGSKTSESAA